MTSGRLLLPEAAWMLQGLYLVNLEQLAGGQPGISEALQRGRVRYIRSDPDERWQSIRDLWVNGGGDCEDLAAAVAAELTHAWRASGGAEGARARPVIYRVRPGLAHAVVELVDTGELLDPSLTGGMGWAE